MTYTPPNKILITSDNNVLEFVKIKKVNKEDLYVYQFIVSKIKLGMETSFTQKELTYQSNNFFKII